MDGKLTAARYTVGIDLGTSHTVVAYADLSASDAGGDHIHLLPIDQLIASGEVAASALLASVRRQDQVGTLLDFWSADELHELQEIEATLPAQGRAVGEVVRVQLHARITTTGTLELEALPLNAQGQPGSERWKVELDTRSSSATPAQA